MLDLELPIVPSFNAMLSSKLLSRHDDLYDFADSTAKPMGMGATSSYWKVPDDQQYLTSVAVHPQESLCAVASGARTNNLFVYELETQNEQPLLTHHQTITLGEIHSLEWVSPYSKLGSQGNVLVSGHKDGLVHMTLLPDTYSSHVPAEIVKRFNHQRHLPGVNSSMRIRNLALSSKNWSCCAESSILTLCADHLFLWDPSRSDLPVIKQKTRGASCLDLCKSRDGIVAVGGRKGISIRDIRVKSGSGLSPPDDNNTAVSTVHWSPTNENWVAAVHDQNVIKIWDIRASGPLGEYRGHAEKVSAVEWSLQHPSHLVSASNDGTIRVWDAQKPTAPSSHQQSPKDMSWATGSNWKMYKQRQFQDVELDSLAREILQESSRPMVAQNKQFVAMKVTGYGAVSIDDDGYFGYHRLKEDPSSPLSSASDSSDGDFLPPISPL